MSSDGRPVELKLAESADTALLAAVVELGDRSRRTLGLLPPAAFADAASAGTLLVAVCDVRLVGYALFGLPRQLVRLSHLCVDERDRGRGVARRLVEEISRLHNERLGIRAKCRRDYGLDPMWWALGFRPRSEMTGRGQDRARLTVWWRDHGHADLLTSAAADALLTAAIDLNVLIDLQIEKSRPAASESHVLLADHLVGQLELVATPALAREISNIGDAHQRARYLAAADGFPHRGGNPREAENLVRRLRALVIAKEPSFPRRPQDDFDARHVAEAAAAGVPVVVTRDTEMRRTFDQIAQRELGVRVLSPADIVVRLDELAHTLAYQPGRLLGTDYQRTRIGSGGEDAILGLLDKAGEERRPVFRATLRRLALAGFDRFVIHGPDSSPVACYAYTAEDHRLIVPLLRVVEHPLAQTLTRQLLFTLRQVARKAGCSVLQLTDTHLSATTRRAAIEDGFRAHAGSWSVLVIDVCADADAVEQASGVAAALAGLQEAPHLRPGLPAPAAAEAERILWPAKITDSQLPTLLVPIQPAWSADLFGVPATATARPTRLGISREHVYYHTPKRVSTPARVLWYAALGRSQDGPGAVIACSLLEQALTDTPESLHRRFQHLGALSLSDIQRQARKGQTQALRFVDTELLPHPVPLRRLRQIATAKGQTLILRSARKIDSDLFAAVYREGHTT